MEDKDLKFFLLIYFIFGVSEYVVIKIKERLWVGWFGELVVEKMKFGRIIMLLGRDIDYINMLLM